MLLAELPMPQSCLLPMWPPQAMTTVDEVATKSMESCVELSFVKLPSLTYDKFVMLPLNIVINRSAGGSALKLAVGWPGVRLPALEGAGMAKVFVLRIPV